jgi:hypothetical protein
VAFDINNRVEIVGVAWRAFRQKIDREAEALENHVVRRRQADYHQQLYRAGFVTTGT